MQVILTNNVTKFSRYYPDITDISTIPIYIEFELDLSDIIDGEYTIYLYDDDNKLLYTEIVRVGEYNRTTTQYKLEKKYKQYNG